MARAIFSDWFVDFGPTRAKAEGRTPYLAPELRELFPDTLDEEDKPVGWRQRILADVAGSPRRGVGPRDVSVDMLRIGLEHVPLRAIGLTQDFLLPKLMCGEIRLCKVERAVEAVA